MNWTHTEQFLETSRAAGRFTTYAVRVINGRDTATFTSPDANADTLFDIASMGKVLVTATLILRAVGTGQLHLDDPIAQYLDTPPDKSSITIRQLLTHTSGIVRILVPPTVAAGGSRAVAAHVLAHPLAFAPGTRVQYSCTGYLLLGYIAEQIFGAPLDTLFARYIRDPLGLTRSKFCASLTEPNTAVSYRWADPAGCRYDDEIVRVLGGVAGNGGSFWSLDDITRYAAAVRDRSPLLYAPECYALAERDATPPPMSEGHGLGWLVVDDRYRQTGRLFPAGSFGHCGHTGTSIFLSRRADRTVIALTNATRCLNAKNHFAGYDYGQIESMRAELHNAIAEDVKNFIDNR